MQHAFTTQCPDEGTWHIHQFLFIDFLDGCCPESYFHEVMTTWLQCIAGFYECVTGWAAEQFGLKPRGSATKSCPR